MALVHFSQPVHELCLRCSVVPVILGQSTRPIYEESQLLIAVPDDQELIIQLLAQRQNAVAAGDATKSKQILACGR